MGWQSFPDTVTASKARAEMLDETIDVLTLMYQRKQFDYAGKHYHLKLTLMDEMHYPPKPIQQPRVPLWAVGFWPREKSLQRTLKCDGIIPEKLNAEGKAEEITPDDIRALKTYVATHRTLTTPFDIVMNGRTVDLEPSERQARLRAWKEAGVTWWIEGLWGDADENVREQIRRGPPQIY
jgi:hypothetical protein